MRTRSLTIVLPFLLACASSSAPASDDNPAPKQGAEVEAMAKVEAEGPPPAADPATAAADEGLCALASYEAWSSCTDKRVRVVGRRPEFVHQHPMMTPPPGVSPGGDIHQGYMDTDDTQVIVLTKAPFDCRAGMSVVGVLDRIDMGGAAGTKESYSGWALLDAEVTCD